MQQGLSKPHFINISEIHPGKHCYNVYCKVIEANFSETTKFNGETLKIVEGKIGDHTGLANFRFIGDNVDKIEEGKIIAIRNGRSEVFEEHIRLEVDKFGKISDEPDQEIGEIDSSYNISDEAYVKKRTAVRN